MSDYNGEVEPIPFPVKEDHASAPDQEEQEKKMYKAAITWFFEASSQEEAEEIAMQIQSGGSEHVSADCDGYELREGDE